MRAFAAALRGIFIAIARERHMKAHLAAMTAVFIAAFILKVEPLEWNILIVVCGLVIAAELFNTAIERLCDKIDPETCPVIKDIKDIAAGAVLVCAAAAAATGVIIFGRIFFSGR